jgi:integrase
MAHKAPYLQRRGFGLTFRIAVPLDLRQQLMAREITKALPTSDRSAAIPMALSLAHQAKLLFNRLRGMTKKKHNPDDKPLEFGYTIEFELDDFGAAKRVKVQAEPHEQAAVNSAIHTAITSSLQGRPGTLPPATPQPRQEDAPKPAYGVAAPMFGAVIEDFLNRYQHTKKPAMFKKHKPVLSMLLEVVGNKAIDSLRQSDINEFFELLGRLPPRWADQCRQQGISVRELAELEHEVTIGPKTFEDTYIASVRPFLKAAKKNFQDQGFPFGLTTDGTEYIGDREEGEYKQRALTGVELKRLFEGEEMQKFADDRASASHFWLPHLGLFTGARVNELCQLNPQTDIVFDSECNTWHLWITTETEADPRIRKSVKTGDSRKVPIHKTLIDLGFLDYVDRVKATGAKLLFPDWQPVNRRASGEAEKWFRQLLRDTDLRDETLKACVLGMHAFRHTLLTYGAMQKPPLSLFCITGHAQDEAPIAATGAGRGYLTLSLLSPLGDRATLLNQLDYGLNFSRPATT